MELEIEYLKQLLSDKNDERYCIDKKSSNLALQAYWSVSDEIEYLKSILVFINEHDGVN